MIVDLNWEWACLFTRPFGRLQNDVTGGEILKHNNNWNLFWMWDVLINVFYLEAAVTDRYKISLCRSLSLSLSIRLMILHLDSIYQLSLFIDMEVEKLSLSSIHS